MLNLTSIATRNNSISVHGILRIVDESEMAMNQYTTCRASARVFGALGEPSDLCRLLPINF
jgi:hypothetical protein